jgi:uncharacterized iron-regulated membrane protein
MQAILWLHRYVGVAIGLVMTLWCLSGFVMLYRGYPQVTERQRLAGLQALDLGRADPARLALGPERLDGFRIEMLAGKPVLRVSQNDAEHVLDLNSGAAISGIERSKALAVARDFARGNRLDAAPRDIALIDKDQWTVEGAVSRGPVYRIGLADPDKTVIYVSQRSGEVVQATNRGSRFWAWLGAVPHWLYPTILRQNARLWIAVVVWTALIGCFLTVTGLFVGVVRLRRYRTGRWSPYRGWHYWHHIIGLVFGIMTLSWVMSGLFTVNPWGFLETSIGESAGRTLEGGIDPADLRRFLAVAPSLTGGQAVALEAAPLDGRLHVLQRSAAGATLRLGATGAPAPLQQGELAAALGRIGGAPVTKLELLRQPDAYYYPDYDHPARAFPVWRARSAGPDPRAYYVDAVSGRLALALDGTARTSRWLRTGLHDLDFPALRIRPVWDVVALTLLAGVTASCVIGAWLGLKRLGHDLRRLRGG